MGRGKSPEPIIPICTACNPHIEYSSWEYEFDKNEFLASLIQKVDQVENHPCGWNIAEPK